MRNENVKRLVRLGLLAAMSVVLMYLVRFPLFPAAPYLEYDMADVPILIGTFLYGPWWGLVLTVAVSVLQGVTVSAASGWVGIVMHICATGVFSLTAGLIYRRLHSRAGALLGLCCGSLVHVAMMIPLNLILTVHYNGVPREVVMGMIWPILVPFNLFKTTVNSAVTFLVYKRVANLLRLEKPEKKEA